MTDVNLLAQLREQFSSAHWPRMDNISRDQDQCVIDVYIAHDMHWLEGHFPQQPVVAGVVQTHWAGELAKALFNIGDEFIRIDNLKFQQVILPGQHLQLTLSYSSTTVKFRYSQNDTLFSEGKLVFQCQSPVTQ